jgi:hypothetical protein
MSSNVFSPAGNGRFEHFESIQAGFCGEKQGFLRMGTSSALSNFARSVNQSGQVVQTCFRFGFAFWQHDLSPCIGWVKKQGQHLHLLHPAALHVSP